MEGSTATSLIIFILTLLLAFTTVAVSVASQAVGESAVEINADAVDQWKFAQSLYDSDLREDVEEEIIGDAPSNRRSLFWKRLFHYYISYGALSANRVPCPPRSGRSYYTHNCFRARGPIHPYTRGCSAITRCRR